MAESGKGGFERMGEQLGETIGETAGRMAGRATDAAMDVAATVFGSAMDALGDWWKSAEAQQAGRSFGAEHDTQAREHFQSRGAAKSYDEVRPLYQFGHVAAHNPDYAGRSFRDVEPQLERAWREEQTTRYGDWPRVRDYVSHGYEQRAGSSESGVSTRDPLS